MIVNGGELDSGSAGEVRMCLCKCSACGRQAYASPGAYCNEEAAEQTLTYGEASGLCLGWMERAG